MPARRESDWLEDIVIERPMHLARGAPSSWTPGRNGDIAGHAIIS